MGVKKLSPTLLILPILVLLGAVVFGSFKLYQVRSFEQYPIVAIVNNNLGIKPKLQRISLSIQEYLADPSPRNFNKIAKSYEVYRASILVDISSHQTQAIHARFGDTNKLLRFIEELKALKQWLPSSESDSKNIQTLSKKLNRLYGNWNVYSRRLVQRVQSYHHDYVSELNQSLGIFLLLMLVMVIVSGFSMYLLYRQLQLKKEVNASLREKLEANYDIIHSVEQDVYETKTEKPADNEVKSELSSNVDDDRPVLEGKQVLIVEDTLINQIITQEFVENMGGEIVIANNGQECLDVLNEKSFDLILMDIHMPIMDGVKATEFIREDTRFKDLPIVALTANTMKEDVERYFAVGMNGCIPKPFTEEDFENTLRSVLR